LEDVMPTHTSERDPSDGDSSYSEQRDEHGFDDSLQGDEELDRVETVVRVLYTLLFFLVIRVVEAVIGVVVLFQLVFALVTNRTPNPAINGFARRVIEYAYQIGHYLTFNRDKPPFPFDELPDED
jgi:hypothetical protein